MILIKARQTKVRIRPDSYRFFWQITVDSVPVSYTHLTLPTIYSV